MTRVIAILCSDIHLCHTCPPARSNEPDWYEAMRRPLYQLGDLATQHEAPVLCAGDVFDRWNPPLELVNMALSMLPRNFIAVPGQHDLPHHSLDDIRKSAFGLLMEVERVCCNDWVVDMGISVNCFPWECEIEEPEPHTDKDAFNIALTHRYVWAKGKGYPGAPQTGLVSNLPKVLKEYDLAVFGDNHQSFVSRYGECRIVNPGCLIPRKQDERHLTPTVYLLHEDGSVQPYLLDTSADKWLDQDVTDDEVTLQGMDEFLETLHDLDVDSLDYKAAVIRYFQTHKVSDLTKNIIMESME